MVVQHVHGVMDLLALQLWTFDQRITVLPRGAP